MDGSKGQYEHATNKARGSHSKFEKYNKLIKALESKIENLKMLQEMSSHKGQPIELEAG